MKMFCIVVLFIFVRLGHLQDIDPCASLSSSYQALTAANESTLFHPSEVLACLQTVPVNTSLAISQIEWYRNFIQFQSTLSYLKEPPEGYALPATDILGELQVIEAKIKAGSYNGEFDIESDIYDLINSAYDGHFSISPELISPNTFTQFRNVALVSVSDNGTDLPKVYFIDDLLETNASDLVSIDGVGVSQAVQDLAFGFQDKDALYNSMLFNIPAAFFNAQYNYNISRTLIRADNTTYEFRNGSKLVVDNTVFVMLPIGSIGSGQELFDKFLDPKISSKSNSGNASQTIVSTSPTQSNSLTSSTAATPTSNSLPRASLKFPASGYPIPLMSTSDFILAGFFLAGSTDTCVMSLLGFENPLVETYGIPTSAAATAYGLEFQNVTKAFLAACSADRRTKLLIDVRSNGGGFVYFAYDLFRQLFPSRIPYSGTRFRAHPAANVMGEVISSLGQVSLGENDTLWSAKISDFNYLNSLSSPEESSFTNWAELYGPKAVHNDTFTNTLAWKFSNVALDLSEAGLVPTGFANNTELTAQPFADENITLITDAQCTSTCTVFVNLLLSQTNVSTIAFGGRPSNDPMAIIGGSQGGERFTFENIASYAAVAIKLLNNNATYSSVSRGLSVTKKDALELLRPLVQDPPLNVAGGVASQALNFRDSIAEGDQTMTPLQFTNAKLADCKVFYLRGDVRNASFTWERIAKGEYVCADGGAIGRRANGASNNVEDATSGASPMITPAGVIPFIFAALTTWFWI